MREIRLKFSLANPILIQLFFSFLAAVNDFVKTGKMTEEEVLFDDVYDLCEEIGRWVLFRTRYQKTNLT